MSDYDDIYESGYENGYDEGYENGWKEAKNFIETQLGIVFEALEFESFQRLGKLKNPSKSPS